jgi:hypothetical protein
MTAVVPVQLHVQARHKNRGREQQGHKGSYQQFKAPTGSGCVAGYRHKPSRHKIRATRPDRRVTGKSQFKTASGKYGLVRHWRQKQHAEQRQHTQYDDHLDGPLSRTKNHAWPRFTSITVAHKSHRSASYCNAAHFRGSGRSHPMERRWPFADSAIDRGWRFAPGRCGGSRNLKTRISARF